MSFTRSLLLQPILLPLGQRGHCPIASEHCEPIQDAAAVEGLCKRIIVAALDRGIVFLIAAGVHQPIARRRERRSRIERDSP